jgi:hypothetical protein
MKSNNFLNKFQVILPSLLLCAALSYIYACNISYVDAPENLPSDLHPSLPPFSNVYHGVYFRFPVKNCDEAQCHGISLKGGNSGAPSCYSCHSDRWSIFTVSHTVSVSGIYHHYNVDSGDFTINCGQSACHGSSLEGVEGQGYSCYACHDPIPAPGHRISREGALHHVDIGKNPEVYCYKPGCHGSSEPGGMCTACHSSAYPTED